MYDKVQGIKNSEDEMVSHLLKQLFSQRVKYYLVLLSRIRYHVLGMLLLGYDHLLLDNAPD